MKQLLILTAFVFAFALFVPTASAAPVCGSDNTFDPITGEQLTIICPSNGPVIDEHKNDANYAGRTLVCPNFRSFTDSGCEWNYTSTNWYKERMLGLGKELIAKGYKASQWPNVISQWIVLAGGK